MGSLFYFPHSVGYFENVGGIPIQLLIIFVMYNSKEKVK